jgi:hypothetical protein
VGFAWFAANEGMQPQHVPIKHGYAFSIEINGGKALCQLMSCDQNVEESHNVEVAAKSCYE